MALTAGDGKVIADGSLLVTIRDPQDRPDGGSAGEGIRMLADPAQPTLSELWDGRAAISIDGPGGRAGFPYRHAAVGGRRRAWP